MRSPLSYILCAAAICAAISGWPGAAAGLLTAAFVTEFVATPR